MIKTTPGTDTIEEEVRSTRQRMDEKTGRLEQRLSPGDMMESVIDFARSNGGAIASGIGRTVRDHPVPVVMIGAGIAWLAMAGRGERDDDVGAGRYTATSARGEGEGMTDKLRQRASGLGESLRERTSGLGERAGDLTHKARDQASRAGRSGGRFVKDHPILVGAAGVALGAAIAAALPRSSREDGMFGERAENARQTAKEAALREARKVQEAAKAAVEKARETAEQKAPTADDLKRDVERTAKAATGGTGPGAGPGGSAGPGTSTGTGPGTSTGSGSGPRSGAD